MKKILFLLLLTSIAFAQDNYKIIYKQSSVVDPVKMKEYMKEVKGSVSFKSPDQYYELLTNEKESYYQQQERIDNDQNNPMSSSGMTIRIGASPKGTYRDITAKTYAREMDLDNKKYVEMDSLETLDWKIKDQTKAILGCSAHYAEAINKENQLIKAWYCPTLPFTGPSLFEGLPGTILLLEYETTGKLPRVVTFEAESIDKNPKRFKMEKPTKGARVTRAEMEALSKESREKMMKTFQIGIDKKLD